MFQGGRRHPRACLGASDAVNSPQIREAKFSHAAYSLRLDTSRKPVAAPLSNRSLYRTSFTYRTGS